MNKLFKKFFGGKLSFTLAEVLLSMVIIAIVAAIVLPTLKSNFDERVMKVKRKALVTRITQAISMMPYLDHYGEYSGKWVNAAVDAENSLWGSVEVYKDTATVAFLTDGLGKNLKIKNICEVEGNDPENIRASYEKCGLPRGFKTLTGYQYNRFPYNLNEMHDRFNMYRKRGTANGFGSLGINPNRDVNTKAVAFETENGESLLLFYNPHCGLPMDKNDVAQRIKQHARYNNPDVPELHSGFSEELQSTKMGMGYDFWTQQAMCANFMYDLNGKKGPNRLMKDIGFITAFYAADPVVVAPMYTDKKPNKTKMKHAEIADVCYNLDHSLKTPNREEAMSIFLNQVSLHDIITTAYTGIPWTNTVIDDKYAYVVTGELNTCPCLRSSDHSNGGSNLIVVCVKNDE